MSAHLTGGVELAMRAPRLDLGSAALGHDAVAMIRRIRTEE